MTETVPTTIERLSKELAEAIMTLLRSYSEKATIEMGAPHTAGIQPVLKFGQSGILPDAKVVILANANETKGTGTTDGGEGEGESESAESAETQVVAG